MKRLLLPLLCIALLSIGAVSPDIGAISSYRDIPGVTAEEISAIEELKRSRRDFSYGCLESTEFYSLPSGGYDGFAIKFCELLNELFDMEFTPVLYEWDELRAGLDDKSLDFTGELTQTPERMKYYYMTHAIAERALRIYTLTGNDEIQTESDVENLKIGFLEDTVTPGDIKKSYPIEFEIVDVPNYETAAEKLKSGEIDAFVEEAVSDPALAVYDFIRSREFFPMVYSSVSMTTANPELAPLISVMDKYIIAGGIDELYQMYKDCDYEYSKHKLFASFADEELAYLDDLSASGVAVKIGLEPDNYPYSFYNAMDKEYQGIAVDVLAEISGLTGIRFEQGIAKDTLWSETVGKLRSGEISMVSQLMYTEARKEYFIWPHTPYTSSYYALISRLDYPNLSIYQVVRTKVGYTEKTAYEDMYREWFPDSDNAIGYGTDNVGFDALEKGEIDLLMTSEDVLLSQLNYRERPGFRVNIRFNSPMYSYFGFNKDEAVLCSIVDKAQGYIDTNTISGEWTSRVFDYSKTLARQSAQYLSIIVGIMALVLVITLYLFVKNQRLGSVLEQKSTTLSTIYTSIPDIVFCKDTNGVYTSCNDSMGKMFGLSESWIIGRNDLEIFASDPETARGFIEADKHVLSGNSAEAFEEWITFPVGGRRLMESIKTPLIENGTVTGLLGISRDITERKAVEEAALAASKAKSLFLAKMSHEIRTPMNAVIGISDLLLAEKLDNRNKQYVQDIKTSATSLLGIINDILDLTKIDENKLKLTPVDFDLCTLMKNIASMMRFSAQSKGLDFIEDIQIKPQEYVHADDVRLNQIIVNLLSNAVKFTDKGYVELAVRIEAGEIRFEVSDTGRGIKSEDIDSVFTPFEQLEIDKNRVIKGTGLGMSISKNLAEMMGGRIWVESEYGVGTTFYLTVPYTPGDVPEAGPDAGAGTIYAPTAKVLLVDDIQTNLTVGSGLLRLFGISADLAVSGREAVEFVQTNTYDLVLMDHMMPEMDGVEATQKLRELGYTLPIIALTANAMTESRDFLLESGMDDYLSKPIDKNELVSMLRKWLPERLLETVSQSAASPEPRSAALEAAAAIDGLNIDLALSRLGGMQDTLEASITRLAHSLEDHVKRMDECLSNANINGFSTDAHGIKGALAAVGAVRNSELAADLELLSKAGNIPQCREKFAVFAVEMENFAGELKAIFPKVQATSSVQGSAELLAEKIAGALGSLDNFEYYEALECITALQKFTYSDETDAILADAKNAVEEYDDVRAVQLLKDIEQGLSS